MQRGPEAEKSGTPYASIIIPVHNRHTTLPYAVQSALNQSIKNIEVVIVGDGCTPAVRAIARRMAKADPRVRFFDQPKAGMRGIANRDFAVRMARAPRIFYNDDDDLLLPFHVEVLGKTLDRVDIVDTPPVSVGTEGHVALGLLDSGNPMLRKMLLEDSFKGVFDTHLAHRKSVYLDRPGAWLGAPDHRVVWHMLKTFAAADELRWRTINRITALSFHGARRVTMTPQARARELQSWSARLETPDLEASLRRGGGYCAHAYQLAMALAKQSASERIELPIAAGLDLNTAPGINKNYLRSRLATLRRKLSPSSNLVSITDAQQSALTATLALAWNTEHDTAGAGRALDELIDPLLGPSFPVAGILSRFVRQYGLDEVQSFLRDVRKRPAVYLAHFHLAVCRGRFDSKDRTVIDAAFENVPSESRLFFGLSVAEGFMAGGDLKSAWEWIDRLLPLAQPSRRVIGFWETRRLLAKRLDRQGDMLAAADYIDNLSVSEH